MAYAKGGYAYFDGAARAVNPGRDFTTANSFVGWTAGGGLEYALTQSWSVKAEYQYFDFGTQNSILTGCCQGGNLYPFRYEHDLKTYTAELGINYHVGNTYEPLK